MERILVNPANRELFLDLFPAAADRISTGLIPPPCLDGIPVVFDPAVPERNIEHKWHPPEAERFVEYGAEDEVWARPLGLGTIEEIDLGPCFWFVKSPLVRCNISLWPAPVGLTSCFPSW